MMTISTEGTSGSPRTLGTGKAPNPFLDAFIRKFGQVKVFRGPLFIVYDPSSYLVKAKQMREVMAAIRPGDLLVRGFIHYLDGYFIPGFFSHVGMYVGKVEDADRALCTEIDAANERDARAERKPKRKGPLEKKGPEELFATGDQMVVHALGQGVLIEDLLGFCRCDFMAILRLPRVLVAGPGAKRATGLSLAERGIEDRLVAGPVSFADVFPFLRNRALSMVGFPYDTAFDFTDFTRLSCTELVHYVTRCLTPVLDVAPRTQRVLFMKQSLIEPDDYVRSAALEPVWWSPSVEQKKRDELRPPAPPAEPGAAARVA